MSVERLLRDFRYDDWANREVLRHLVRESAPPPRALAWLAHVLGTQAEWHARLPRTKSELAVWPALTADECEDALPRLRASWTRYLDALAPATLAGTIEYVNSKGKRWTSRVDDVLAHVVLHGAYHRGQIACELRAVGLTPPYTDYVHATRSGALA
jgi:uncharacterized damage-inducible protein DinB